MKIVKRARFSRSGTCKGEVNVYRFISKHSSDHFFVAIPYHTSPLVHFNIMNEAVINESLRKICYYQQNLPEHYYLLATLVVLISAGAGLQFLLTLLGTDPWGPWQVVMPFRGC